MTSFGSLLARNLTGLARSPRESRGLDNPTVRVGVVPPAGAAAVPTPGDLELPAGAVFRAVPLLAVLQAGNDRLVAVGQSQILIARGVGPVITVVVRALWVASTEGYGGGVVTNWRAIDDHERLAGLVEDTVRRARHETPDDLEWQATAMAKALAEASHNAIAELRSFRYGLERLLGENLRGGPARDLEPILADIIELSTVCGRTCDEAREAAREGMWTWRTDPDAYHAHRGMLDVSLPPRPGNREGRRRPWFRVLDAGVRQCLQMERLAAEEAPFLHSLLNSASTIAVTRDARAQETFNLIATVGGVMLGVPGLILAMYGASDVLPLTRTNAVVLVPLAVAALLASLPAVFLPGRGRQGRAKRFVAVLAAVFTTVLLLAVAGVLVTPQGGTPGPRPTPAPAVSR
jgi:hypothetical protein